MSEHIDVKKLKGAHAASARSAARKAHAESIACANLISEMHEGDGPVGRVMPKLRARLALLNKWVHEFSAYHNCSIHPAQHERDTADPSAD